MRVKNPKQIELSVDGQTFMGKCNYVRFHGKDIELVISIDGVVNNKNSVTGELIFLNGAINEIEKEISTSVKQGPKKSSADSV